MREEAAGQGMLAQPVRGLQYMLRRLSGYYRFLPELEMDGIFGEKTMEAVMLFQRELHPPVTGAVDWGTWNAIRDQWMELEKQLADPRALRAFPGERCWVEPGANKEFMILPQTMFQVLSRQFNGISPHEADGFHGPMSSDNVRWLQRAAGMEETGIMDAVTWAVLSNLYEIFVVKDLEDGRTKFVGGWG
ncbi:MAG: peptidoglycan-binding protein [Lawsonibacter sp.]